MARKMVPHDGNSATAHVAHAVSEVCAIYPITPSSPMGETSDEKSARGEKNIWGTVPEVAELQSEGGAAGAVHGALSTGALTTTFTASQGLLLMIPNMYKIAGELTPTVFHVSARSLAAQALSIFGDHSDVMGVRQTGFALLASNSVQEAMDMALISHSATLKTRIPFLHFFDGFRVSHEIQKIEELTFDDMKEMIDNDAVIAHRARALSPDHPTIMGTAQNPDVYFQGRETVNNYYTACPGIVQEEMDKFAKLTGRQYKLFDYYGADDAENVIIAMGSGCETIIETVDYLNTQGKKVGLVIVRLFRPFDTKAMVAALPKTVKKIAVLDRTKEPGSIGEPLYYDVRTAMGEVMESGEAQFDQWPKVLGGRYGLGSYEFTPAMIIGVIANLEAENSKNHFIIGPVDDKSNTSLDYDRSISIESDKVYRAMFYGLGSDGTVGANKNTIKIIGEETENYTQGYFVYDSKKAGAITTSHLRFGPDKIKSPYLISNANFIACHQPSFLEKYDMLKNIDEGGIFLLNTSFDKDTVWASLPGRVQKQIIDKKVKFYVIDALKISEEVGLGQRFNVVLQTAFFKISNVIDLDTAINAIKKAITKTYGSKGEAVVNMNIEAVDKGLDQVFEVEVPAAPSNEVLDLAGVPENAPDFVKEVTNTIMQQNGDKVTVSQMPEDGTWPTATTQYEKRNIAVQIPVWGEDACIQCGRCSLVCPHACIRMKAYDPAVLDDAPETFKSVDAKGKDLAGKKFTIQVSPEDCTGCKNCMEECPAKAKGALTMAEQAPLRKAESENWDFFLNKIPETDVSGMNTATVKGSQFIKPLFEFSGACLGCGETAYIKLVSQLVGDRLMVANATGCSSIYGGNLPTTPYTTRADGRGPTWNNSLFEDNAELAFGMRLTADKFEELAKERAAEILECGCLSAEANEALKASLDADQSTQEAIEALRAKIDIVKPELEKCGDDMCKDLLSTIDYLVKKSVWAFGGDGWAYDIGYGGLDHVLASGKNVNIMVMDTEVYSNTGGQASKATPMGAVAKFAAGGKPVIKKDLGMIAMSYGYIYVAKVAMGANYNQIVKAIKEAEAFDGPSLILCYSHCIAHGIDMTHGYEEQRKAVQSGHWPLYRYNPDLVEEGKNPLILDSKEPTISVEDFAYGENRFRILQKSNAEMSKLLIAEAQKSVDAKLKTLKGLSEMDV